MMSILPSLSRPTVSVIFADHELVLAWIEQKGEHYLLKSFARIPLSSFVVVDSSICNPIALYNHIVAFLDVHGLRDSFFYCVLSGSVVVEYFVKLSTEKSMAADFVREDMQTKNWNILYLYALDNSQGVWHYAGVDYALLFQYLLFAQSRKLNMVVLTTPFLAHVAAYKKLHQYLRQNQFAHDLQATGNDLSKLFSVSTLNRLMLIQASGVDVERDFLALHTLFGLLFVDDLTV